MAGILRGRRHLWAAVLAGWLVVLPAGAVTPELGKGKLRRLVKLPLVSFPANWVFDPERGFQLGTPGAERAERLAEVGRELGQDPDDPVRLRELGTLLDELNEPARARAARNRALQIFKRRLELQPDNARVLREYGRTLAEAARSDEAESALRRAVELAPEDWQNWLALGRFLDTESRRDIFERARVAPDARTAGRGRSGGTVLAPDRVALARRRLAEAGACYDTARTHAEAEPEVHLRRGLHLTLQNYLLHQIRQAAGERPSEAEALRDFFSPECVAELRRASELSPRDYHLLGNVALFELYSLSAQSGRAGIQPEATFQTLPESAQRTLRHTLARLEDLAGDANRRLASGALEVLGILQGPVLHEPHSALASLERALALDPTRGQAWELAAGTLARTGDYAGLLDLSEDRLRREDTLRSRLLLAKAYEKLRRWEEAEGEVLAALQKSPDDFTANLALTALLLRRSDDPETLAEAGTWLGRSDKALSRLTAAQKPRELLVEYSLLRAVYLGLTDDVEGARQWTNSVLEVEPENPVAKEILAAMDY